MSDLMEFVCPIPGCNCDIDYRAAVAQETEVRHT